MSPKHAESRPALWEERWLRYALALLAGGIAMFAHVFLSFRMQGWFAPQRWSSAIAGGLMFGHGLAFMVLLARDVPLRLHGPVWRRVLLSLLGGLFFGTLAWWSHVTLLLLNTNPDWGVLLLGGAGLSAGFIVAGARPGKQPGWLRFAVLLLTMAAVFLPIYVSFQSYLTSINTPKIAQALLYFEQDNPEHVWLIGLPFAFVIALLGQLPWLLAQHEEQ